MTKTKIQDTAIDFLTSEKQKLSSLLKMAKSKNKKREIAKKMLFLKQKMIWEIRNIDVEITRIRGENP